MLMMSATEMHVGMEDLYTQTIQEEMIYIFAKQHQMIPIFTSMWKQQNLLLQVRILTG